MTKSRLILAIGLVLLPVFTIIGVGATEFTVETTKINYRGEIVETDDALRIAGGRISVANSDADQDSSPVELHHSKPRKNVTDIFKGHLIYTVTIEEETVDSAPSGVTWEATLYLNGNPIGTIELQNNTNDSTSNEEGVILRWDLGVTSLGGGSEPDLIEVEVRRLS